MVFRTPVGLSKATIEYRRTHQIPCKRPTQMAPLQPKPKPKPKPAPSCSGQSSHRPKPKKARLGTQEMTPNNGAHIEERQGHNRSAIAGSSGTSTRPIRRIIGSRQKPGDPSTVEYKVQWDTSWEDSSTITGRAIKEWNDAIFEDQIFTYYAQDGSRWEVLQDSHATENDSEDLQWEMWTAIHRNAVEETETDWLTAMEAEDFAFTDVEDRTKAEQVAARYGMKRPGSALEVLQTAWNDVRDFPVQPDDGIVFGDVNVRFLGRLDRRYNDDNGGIQRPSVAVGNIICAVRSNPLGDLHENAFSQDHGTYENCERWRQVTRDLIRTAPFMFKKGTWMQLFAFLLLGSEALVVELESVGVRMKDGWTQHAREYAMHMYHDHIVDDRPIHDIQETFLNLREFFRDLEPDVNAKAEQPIVIGQGKDIGHNENGLSDDALTDRSPPPGNQEEVLDISPACPESTINSSRLPGLYLNSYQDTEASIAPGSLERMPMTRTERRPTAGPELSTHSQNILHSEPYVASSENFDELLSVPGRVWGAKPTSEASGGLEGLLTRIVQQQVQQQVDRKMEDIARRQQEIKWREVLESPPG